MPNNYLLRRMCSPFLCDKSGIEIAVYRPTYRKRGKWDQVVLIDILKLVGLAPEMLSKIVSLQTFRPRLPLQRKRKHSYKWQNEHE